MLNLNVSEIDECIIQEVDLTWLVNFYIQPTLCSFNFLASGICALVFTQILRQSAFEGPQMFKYLLVKAIYDGLMNFLNIWTIWLDCQSCAISSTYTFQIFYIYLIRFLTGILSICSHYLELAATFDCFVTINGLLRCSQSKRFFWAICITIVLFATAITCPESVAFEIIHKMSPDFNTTDVGFTSEMTTFYKGNIGQAYRIFSVIVENFPVILILILNACIVFTLKRSAERKKRLTSVNNPVSQSVRRAEKAERSRVLMVLLTGLNFVLGQWPIIFSFLIYNGNLHGSGYGYVAACFSLFTNLLFYLSFTTLIFLYYFFNTEFRRHFNNIFCILASRRRDRI